MQIKKYRSGMDQNDRSMPALLPSYVSVEERSIEDLLKYIRRFASTVRFYDQNNWEGDFWTSFLNFSDQEIRELVEFIKKPDISENDVRFSKPHLTLLFTFVKLLSYPKKQFAQLTERNLDFFYKKVLKLNLREEIPDLVHVIVNLVRDINEHLIKKGTLLSAGKDNTGVDLHYEIQEDIVVNKAEIADIKTIHFDKSTNNVKFVHQINDKGDIGFEKMLCLVLGNIAHLPIYHNAYGNKIQVNVQYLRTELYERINGKKRDDLEESDANYLFNSLCFRYLKDFKYCLNLLYREMNRGYVGITLPEDSEWEKAYTLLEDVHNERIARIRRTKLKDIYKNNGFQSMMEFAFGDPNPWDMLYKMPGKINTLDELFHAKNEAARNYVEKKLCMSFNDFSIIMKKKNTSLSGISEDELYTILETAWTKKRNYQYPPIGSEIIKGYYADTIYSAIEDDSINRFHTFSKSENRASSEDITMGFAISSPLLRLHEGHRKIEIIASCQQGSIDHDKISLLLGKRHDIFITYLSTAGGWQKKDNIDFETGKFIIKPELKTYSRKHCYLICDARKYEILDVYCVNKFLLMNNGNVYKIEQYDDETNKIYLKSTHLQYPTDNTKLITQLIPKIFVSELKEKLNIDEYAFSVKSFIETFHDYYQGKFFVDNQGKIFYIKKFIAANEVEIRYSGTIKAKDDPLVINKVWESIIPEYIDYSENASLSDLSITEVYAAEKEFKFIVSDRKMSIKYPQGSNASDLITAWEEWKDNPLHNQGRFELEKTDEASWDVSPLIKEIERTGEIIKRYESIEEKGIKVTYKGGPADNACLTILEPSTEKENASFLISGGKLTITPGAVAKTANQIVADWYAWVYEEGHDAQGYSLESKDNHIWDAVPVDQETLLKLDKQIKKCDICNLYGNGIRILYTGPKADNPKLILQENCIDLFEFTINEKQILTIKYPSFSVTSAHDLVEAWKTWKNVEVNDPGNFEIEQRGDGLWTIRGRTEKEFQSSYNQIIECTIDDVGIIAMFKLSEEYKNAVIEFIEDQNTTQFTFQFEDLEINNIYAKKINITYPPLPKSNDNVIQNEYRIRHVQELLSAWNKEYKKHGFFIIKIEDEAKWTTKNLPKPFIKNFLDDLNYVCILDPNGFRMKYKPADDYTDPFTAIPGAKVVIQENEQDSFAFHLANDYPNNLKILFIRYPISKKNRTVEELLNAWKNKPGSLLQKDSLYWEQKGKLGEFSLEQYGTGKWKITGVSEKELTSSTKNMEINDPVNLRFYEYKTKDVQGFTVYYSGPRGIAPEVTMVEHEKDTFEISVFSSFDAFHDVYIEESMLIKYPKRVEKRSIINLLQTWNKWKKTEANHHLGFELIDTSLVLEKRSESQLLRTGDFISEFTLGTGNGMKVTYVGHRENISFEIDEIYDFTDEDRGKCLVWDNGEVFNLIEKLDTHTISVEHAGNIDQFDRIRKYEMEAICFEALKFTIDLDREFPTLAPLPSENIIPWPVIKILLNKTRTYDQTPGEAVLYNYFRSISLERIDINVTAEGVQDLTMRGDLAIVNPQNPFNPFGLAPRNAARFYFANKEICEKKLNSLQIHLQWEPTEFMTDNSIPDMERYYYTYSHCGMERIGTIKNVDFDMELSFLNQRTWIKINPERQNLFEQTLAYSGFSNQTYQADIFTDDEQYPKDPLDWPRCYKLELSNQGFMKNIYENVAEKIVQAANRTALAETNYNTIKQEIKARQEAVKAAKITEAEAREKGDSYFPPVLPEARTLPSIPENDKDISQLTLHFPYTPTIQSMSIDYTASAKIILNDSSLKSNTSENPLRFFRFHPFGFKELGIQNDKDNSLLPQYEKQGYLFLGIKNIKPLQNVSLLIQMVSGSGEAKLTIPSISWSYLSSNRWVPFKNSEILKDSTYGLQNTGIIKFSIPKDATIDNTILPTQRCWIRAEAQNNITAVPDILDIRTQSVSALYKNKGNDPDHLTLPLSANTIHELVTRDYAIKEIEQPYSSLYGKKKEEKKEFYIRISERLNNKNRALNLKDYENLILSKFSEIYKVKCIPQDELKILDSSSAGEVVIVVILKNMNATPFFPLKPKTPANILRNIETYIQSLMPPLVKVRVKNPRFEEIRYRLAVKFKQGYAQGFYINKINEDIKRYLSPWAYEKDAPISFSSSVYSSSVINYLENTEYVDYIANFTLHQQIIAHEMYTEVIPLFLTDDNAATVKYPDSILVSAENHIVDVIYTDLYDASAFRGIGYMKIGSDFWISRPGPIFTVGIGEMEIETWPVLRYIFKQVQVQIKVIGIVDTVEVKKIVDTSFGRDDSQKIWDTLKDAGYIDSNGNMLPDIDLYDEEFQFLISGKDSFKDYILNNLAVFSFDLKLEATDFIPSAPEDVQFSYQVKELINLDVVENGVISILKAALEYTGISQYPFIVY